VPPFIENDRTMVPVRFISEAFGAEVSWDENARLVTIAKDHGVLIQLEIGSHVMRSVYTMRAEYIPLPDGEMIENTGRIHTIHLDVAAVIRDGRTFIPVRSIADVLGIITTWDYETRTVIFTTTLVLDDFPEGFVYVEQYQFTGDYGTGLSPRGAALRLLSSQMRLWAEYYERFEAEPHIHRHIVLVDSVPWQGIYSYGFVLSDEVPVLSNDPNVLVSLDGAMYGVRSYR